MDTLIPDKMHYLRNQLAAQQAYIRQLETLLENKDVPCREVLDELKKNCVYVDHLHFDQEALAEGGF